MDETTKKITGTKEFKNTFDEVIAKETKASAEFMNKLIEQLLSNDTYLNTLAERILTTLDNKAAANHNHNYNDLNNKPLSLKNPYSITVNNQTYDGSSTVNVGTIGIAYGGTGASNASNARNNLGLGSAATKSSTDSITSNSSSLITSGAVYNAKQELDNKINTINNDLNNYMPTNLKFFRPVVVGDHFPQYVADFLKENFSITGVNYVGSDGTYDPQTGKTDWKHFNVITFGTPTRCVQIAFENHYLLNQIFVRNQYNNNVTDWVRIN